MPHYFMHLRDGTDELLDPDGIDMSAEAVPDVALRTARDCLAGDIRAGRLDLYFRLDVHDGAGQIVHTLPFKEAVQINLIRA